MRRAVLFHALELAKALDAHLDGAEVGQRATQPAAGDVELTGANRLLVDDVGGLALGAHEEHVSAARDRVAHELVGLLEELRRLVEIDDVDAVARAVDVRAHARVPALGLVTEVHTGIDQGAEADGKIAARDVGGSERRQLGRFGDFMLRCHLLFSFRLCLPSPAADDSGEHRIEPLEQSEGCA